MQPNTNPQNQSPQPEPQPAPAPAYVPMPTSYTPEQIAKSNKSKLVWGLIALIGPTALVIMSIVLYAIFNFVTGGSDGSPIHSIINVLMFLVGAIAVCTWLPGVIVGIILLATRKRTQ